MLSASHHCIYCICLCAVCAQSVFISNSQRQPGRGAAHPISKMWPGARLPPIHLRSCWWSKHNWWRWERQRSCNCAISCQFAVQRVGLVCWWMCSSVHTLWCAMSMSMVGQVMWWSTSDNSCAAPMVKICDARYGHNVQLDLACLWTAPGLP